MQRYERRFHESPHLSEAWLAHQAEKIDRALAALEADPPKQGRDIGAIALACALGYLDLEFEGGWRAGHPRLVAWLDQFASATPAFEATRVAG